MKVQCTLNCTPKVVYVQLLGCSFFNQVYERIENCCIKGFKPGESEKNRKERGRQYGALFVVCEGADAGAGREGASTTIKSHRSLVVGGVGEHDCYVINYYNNITCVTM